jgi:hypothetical protein
VFAANLHFWSSGGYFADPSEEKPLLHTWSLAVEEQFYLLMPWVLLLCFRMRAMRNRRTLLGAIAVAALLSLLGSVYGVARHPSAAYYMLPTRAWELLLGSFVALLPVMNVSRVWREAAATGGILAVVLPCLLYPEDTPFPGVAALPPCVGTAVFIWASAVGTSGSSLPTAARVLATRSIVFVGLISYSLYLWHWPLFAFSHYWFLESLSVPYRVGMLVLAFLVAMVSWRTVETPFRRREVCRSKRAMLTAGGMALVIVFLLGMGVVEQEGFPVRIPGEVLAAAEAKADRDFIHELTPADVADDRLVRIGVDDPSAPIWGLVWGDSHAMAAMPAFDEFMKTHGLAGRQVTRSATAPLFGYYVASRYGGLQASAIAFGEAILEYVERHRVANVFLVVYWSGYTGPHSQQSADFDHAIADTVARLRQAGAQPWVMLQVPTHPVDVPKLTAKGRWRSFHYSRFLGRPSSFNGLHGEDRGLLDRLVEAGGKLLDPRPYFLGASGSWYVVEAEGTILYSDRHHLTVEGAKRILVPMLRTATGVALMR